MNPVWFGRALALSALLGECRRRRSKLRQHSYILSGGGEQELVSRAGGSTPKPEDAFEMGEEHLDFLAQMSRLFEGRRAGEGSSKIAFGFDSVVGNYAGICSPAP